MWSPVWVHQPASCLRKLHPTHLEVFQPEHFRLHLRQEQVRVALPLSLRWAISWISAQKEYWFRWLCSFCIWWPCLSTYADSVLRSSLCQSLRTCSHTLLCVSVYCSVNDLDFPAFLFTEATELTAESLVSWIWCLPSLSSVVATVSKYRCPYFFIIWCLLVFKTSAVFHRSSDQVASHLTECLLFLVMIC